MQWSKWKLKQNHAATEILFQLFSTQHLPIAIFFFWSISAGNHYCHRQPAFLGFQSWFIYLTLFRLLETFYRIKFTEMQIHFLSFGTDKTSVSQSTCDKHKHPALLARGEGVLTCWKWHQPSVTYFIIFHSA